MRQFKSPILTICEHIYFIRRPQLLLELPPNYGHTPVNAVLVTHTHILMYTMHITFWTHSNPHAGIDSMQYAEYTSGISTYKRNYCHKKSQSPTYSRHFICQNAYRLSKSWIHINKHPPFTKFILTTHRFSVADKKWLQPF